LDRTSGGAGQKLIEMSTASQMGNAGNAKQTLLG
jgi:hypothetical protein